MSTFDIENAQQQLRKGFLEFCILLALKQRAMYSSDIGRTLKHADLIVVEGTLYPLLNRLKRNGLLTYEWQESPNGPPRKYYTLTPDGLAALKHLDTTWKSLSSTLKQLHAKPTPAKKQSSLT